MKGQLELLIKLQMLDSAITKAQRVQEEHPKKITHLEETLEHYLTHPEALAEKRRVAVESARALHDNDRIARALIGHYHRLMALGAPTATRPPGEEG